MVQIQDDLCVTVSQLQLSKKLNLWAKIPFMNVEIELDQLSAIPRVQPMNCKVKISDQVNDIGDYNPPDYEKIKIVKKRVLTGESALKKTVMLTLDIASFQWNYVPGDVIKILAPNNDLLVQKLASLLYLNLNDSVSITLKDQQSGNEQVSLTVEDVLKWQIDICSFPKKAFFRALAEHCSNSTDKNYLLYLCSKQGSADYRKLMEFSPTLIDILQTFPSVKIDLSFLLSYTAQLQPRQFSIASSPLKQDNTQIDILFNIVDYESQLGEIKVQRYGVCTKYLDQLSALSTGQTLLAQVRESNNFVAPPLEKNLIMICAGTGIAPFLGFMQHRSLAKQLKLSGNTGNSWLFYGCRKFKIDSLCHDEIKSYLNDQSLTHCNIALSQDDSLPISNDIKFSQGYVQHALQKEAQNIFNWIDKDNCILYLCGDASGMIKDVQSTILQIIKEQGQLDEDESKQYFKNLLLEKRYLCDIW